MTHVRVFAAGIIAGTLLALPVAQPVQSPDQGVETYFSPKRGATERYIKSMNLCRSTYDLAIYDVARGPLPQALVDLTKRGRKVRVLGDHRRARENEHTALRWLRDQGVSVRVYKAPQSGLMHHKFAIVDAKEVITGSYNWSKSADERNSENIVVVNQVSCTSEFQTEFDRLWAKGVEVPEGTIVSAVPLAP